MLKHRCWWQILSSKGDFIFWIFGAEFLPTFAAACPFSDLFWRLWLGPGGVHCMCWIYKPSISCTRLIWSTYFTPICSVQRWLEACLKMDGYFWYRKILPENYLKIVRFRTVSVAVQLPVPLLLGLCVIFFVFLSNMALPECLGG